MKKLIGLSAWLLILAIPSTQAHALQRVTAWEVSAAIGDFSRMLDQVDLNDAAIAAADAELTEKKSISFVKVLNRFQKKLPRAERRIGKQVDRMSDDQVAAELTHLNQNLSDAESNRAALKSAYLVAVKENMSELATAVSEAGSVKAFLSKAKKILKGDYASHSDKKLDRAPANEMGKTGLIVCLGTIALVVTLGLLIGWAVVLITYFSLGFAAIIGLIIYKNND